MKEGMPLMAQYSYTDEDRRAGRAQLRRAVADLTVEKQILKDIAQGNL
jgi:hypothetical protein